MVGAAAAPQCCSSIVCTQQLLLQAIGEFNNLRTKSTVQCAFNVIFMGKKRPVYQLEVGMMQWHYVNRYGPSLQRSYVKKWAAIPTCQVPSRALPNQIVK